ncbi:hypothetical protein IGI04_023547, partial [Brassica rapa subsp. trilocularis]
HPNRNISFGCEHPQTNQKCFSDVGLRSLATPRNIFKPANIPTTKMRHAKEKPTFSIARQQTVILTKIFSNTYPSRRVKKALPGDLKIILEEMLDSYHTSHISREHIAAFKAGRNHVKNDTGNVHNFTDASDV